MNSREEIQQYQQEERLALWTFFFEAIRWMAQVATPIILALILWRHW